MWVLISVGPCPLGTPNATTDAVSVPGRHFVDRLGAAIIPHPGLSIMPRCEINGGRAADGMEKQGLRVVMPPGGEGGRNNTYHTPQCVLCRPGVSIREGGGAGVEGGGDRGG